VCLFVYAFVHLQTSHVQIAVTGQRLNSKVYFYREIRIKMYYVLNVANVFDRDISRDI
jgi:hypothetical protein